MSWWPFGSTGGSPSSGAGDSPSSPPTRNIALIGKETHGGVIPPAGAAGPGSALPRSQKGISSGLSGLASGPGLKGGARRRRSRRQQTRRRRRITRRR